MDSRRQFILEGLKQAGLVFAVLVLFTLITLLIGRALVLWVVSEGGSSIFNNSLFRPIWIIGNLIGLAAASILTGPAPTLLTFFDISDRQLLVLSCVLIIPYWAFLGATAGLLQRPNHNSDPNRQIDLSVKQIRKRIRWTIGIAAFVIAALFFLDGPIAGSAWLSSRQYSAGAYRNAIINEVRQLDGAKNEFILKKNPPTNHIVTEADLMPYIKLNSKGQIPRFGPERYVLNPLNQPVYAVFDSDFRVRRRGWHEGFTITNGTIFRLP